jgi:broad-specificity NMP kinase
LGAKALGKLLDCPFRSVGDAVRTRSRELGISPDSFHIDEHRRIDEVTRSFARSAQSRVVIEGTFLDALLSDLDNVCIVELTCSEEERKRRFVSREAQCELGVRDNADEKLRIALHGDHRGKPQVTIDTTSKAPDEVAKEISAWIQTRNITEQRS